MGVHVVTSGVHVVTSGVHVMISGCYMMISGCYVIIGGVHVGCSCNKWVLCEVISGCSCGDKWCSCDKVGVM